MVKFWILILVAFFATNSLDKAESVKVKLEETQLKTFDEIFGEGWLDKGEAEDLKTPAPTNFGQLQINRQNTQLEQIEPKSTDQNKNNAEEKQKRKIIDKFHAIKEEFKQKGKFSAKEWNQIEGRIAKHLNVKRTKIYKWKKEFGLSRKKHNFGKKKEERKHLVEKFDQIKAELMRDGFKNSYPNQINETVAKELGLCFRTICRWKQKLGQSAPIHKHSHNEQKELMKLYYEIKAQTPKISDEKITKMLKIGIATLYIWKRQFKRQQFHPNSIDGHSVEENAAPNVQAIETPNSGSY